MNGCHKVSSDGQQADQQGRERSCREDVAQSDQTPCCHYRGAEIRTERGLNFDHIAIRNLAAKYRLSDVVPDRQVASFRDSEWVVHNHNGDSEQKYGSAEAY